MKDGKRSGPVAAVVAAAGWSAAPAGEDGIIPAAGQGPRHVPDCRKETIVGIAPARLIVAVTAALAVSACPAGPAEADKPAADGPATRPAPGKPDLPGGWKLLYEGAFDATDALEAFEFTDPEKWRWAAKDGDGCLEALGKDRYRAKYRSPLTIALLRDHLFGDFLLEVDLLQTSREYGHRDMCVYFGFTGPTAYYYAHLGTKHDAVSHNVLIVNAAPRKGISRTATQGVAWDKGWHRVRVVRRAAEGTIEVYFDDVSKPVLTASDKTFPKGRIGLGSFDDSGLIDNIRIWGPAVEKAKTDEVLQAGRVTPKRPKPKPAKGKPAA